MHWDLQYYTMIDTFTGDMPDYQKMGAGSKGHKFSI